MMDYDDLERFIRKEMRMTHVYQPLMLRTLLESDNNTASVDDIAQVFLNSDRSQLNYYKRIVKRWPHDTLVKRRRVVSYDKGTYRLAVGGLDSRQRQKLIEMCNLRLQEFVDKDPWIQKIRELDQSSVSGSLRYDILSRSRGMCVACGKSSAEAPLDIDHIIPRSRGGRTEPANLQALCYQCNREKRDRDELDFVKMHKKIQFRSRKCPLCDKPDIARSNHLACAIPQRDPEHAHIILPKRHVGTLAEMFPAERQMCMTLMDDIMQDIRGRTDIRRFDISGADAAGGGHYRIRMAPIA